MAELKFSEQEVEQMTQAIQEKYGVSLLGSPDRVAAFVADFAIDSVPHHEATAMALRSYYDGIASGRQLLLDEQALAAPTNAARYRWLRARPIDAISAGGVFAGKTPDNVVMNGADLDAAIDAAIQGEAMREERAEERHESQPDDQTWPVAWIDPEDLKALQDGCRVDCTLQPCDYGGDVPLYASPDDERAFCRQVMEQRDSLADAADKAEASVKVLLRDLDMQHGNCMVGAGKNTGNTSYTEGIVKGFGEALRIVRMWADGPVLKAAPSGTKPAVAVVGYMVHGDDIRHAAMYPLSQREEAFDACRRWKHCITALAAHPDGPDLPTS
jgi:hypothetical protein